MVQVVSLANRRVPQKKMKKKRRPVFG